jgi:hypothetical protein
MIAANPNPMEKPMVSVLVVANAGGGGRHCCVVCSLGSHELNKQTNKQTHQPRTNTPSAKKTWVEVIKSRGINVQIVLGNGNLGLTAPTTRRGERQGGAARRLGKKAGVGERGEEGKGAGCPKVTGEDGTGTKPSQGERGAETGGGGGAAAL